MEARGIVCILLTAINVFFSVFTILYCIYIRAEPKILDNTLQEAIHEMRRYQDIMLDHNCNYDNSNLKWLWSD